MDLGYVVGCWSLFLHVVFQMAMISPQNSELLACRLSTFDIPVHVRLKSLTQRSQLCKVHFVSFVMPAQFSGFLLRRVLCTFAARPSCAHMHQLKVASVEARSSAMQARACENPSIGELC